jgi:hypothetical protein
VNRPDVMNLMRDANPHPESDELTTDAWSTAVLLADIDMRRQHMGMDLETRDVRVTPTPPPRRDSRWLIAVAAFVATVAVVGLVAWLGGGEPGDGVVATTTTTEATATTTSEAVEPTETPTTTVGVTTTTATNAGDGQLSAEQTAFVTEYVDAFNAGDVDRYFALFAEGFTIEFDSGATGELIVLDPSDPGYVKEALDLPTFMMRTDTRLDVDIDRCEDRDGTIVCIYWRTDPLIQRVLLRVQEVVHLDVSDGQITRVRHRCSACLDTPFVLMLDGFATWMSEYDFATSEKMINSSGEPVFTEESARLWLEYLPIYFEQGF